MTRQLSNEIIFTIIFNCLDTADLLTCQSVCRSWYHPARVKFLENVELTGNRAIEQFIAAFDDDQDQSYFNAIKNIELSLEHTRLALSKDDIEKLLFRFPNLESVSVDHVDLFTHFDEDLCNKLLSHCPKLDTFDVEWEPYGPHLLLLENIRPLLTNMQISYESTLNEMDVSAAQYITRFPRLKFIYYRSDELDTIESFLPILEQLSNVNALHIPVHEDMEEDFWENYLSDKSTERQDLIKRRLSSITNLRIFSHSEISNALKFVVKHFTGLKYFALECEFFGWEPEDVDSAFREIVELYRSTDCMRSVEVRSLSFTTLAENFTPLVQIMFQNVPTIYKQSQNRILKLRRGMHSGEPECDLEFDSIQSPFSREVCISLERKISLGAITSQLFESGAPVDEIDVFSLEIPFQAPHSLVAEAYLDILETMPFLKHAIYVVTAPLVQATQEDNEMYTGPVLPQIEEATFTGNCVDSMQPLLDCGYFAFPNLMRLNVNGYSGVWADNIGEYQVNLQDYSLEKLTLDVGPVVRKMNKRFEKKEKFFVLEIEIASSTMRRFYKVSDNLSSPSSINETGLKGFKLGKDYLRVRLIVTYLEQLDLCIQSYDETTHRCVVMR